MERDTVSGVRLGPFAGCVADLAPGDAGALDADWSQFSIERVRSADHPSFAESYARLWREFGERGEMERREVIADRLAWDPRAPVAGYALLYEMLVVRRHGEIVAVRDHTAIVPGGSPQSVIVHLSHVLVEPPLRGTGLASWLRALPLQAGRACAAAAGALSSPVKITLVAEMEHDDETAPAVVARLRSYKRAGFLMVEPEDVPYAQPDFRSPAEIDRSSVRAVPLCLLLRRVGREHEASMSGAELREVVMALHAMFGVHVRPDHMAPLRSSLDRFPPPNDTVALVSPWREPAARPEKRS